MKTKLTFLLALTFLFLFSGFVYAKDLIVDVYFDDGSVLTNAKFKPSSNTQTIKVKHENEFFTLDVEDLKTLEFGVESGTSKVEVCRGTFPCIQIGKEAIVTLKIKTKIGAVVIDRFSTAESRSIAWLKTDLLCNHHTFSFVSKLTGKEIIQSYGVTNLKIGKHKSGGDSGCFFQKGETKAIKSIVFKDGIEKETAKGLTQPTNVPTQGAGHKLSVLPEKGTREQGQVYPNTRDLQEAGAAAALGNYQEAIPLFMSLAKQGNPLAQGSLGMMYYTGKGVSQNYKEAIKWYTKAAEQGYPLALFDLGVMYEKGHGVSQDYQIAIKWWTKAAEQNHLNAQYSLGLTYAKNMSVPDDLITAYKWANMAAASGHKEAKKLLNILRKRMTNAQIAEGQRLSEELIKKVKPVRGG